MYNILLVGEKVWLCERVKNDVTVATCAKWMNDRSINKFIGRHSRHTKLAEQADYFDNRAKEPYSYAIVDKVTNTYIGNCDIRVKDTVAGVGKIGIFIGEHEFLGKGFGADAIKTMLEFCFNSLNLHSVRLSVFEDNERAVSCYTKCGFTITGVLREAAFYEGEYHNIIEMDILRREFLQNTSTEDEKVFTKDDKCVNCGKCKCDNKSGRDGAKKKKK